MINFLTFQIHVNVLILRSSNKLSKLHDPNEYFKIIDRRPVPNYIEDRYINRCQGTIRTKVAIKSQEMLEFPRERETGGGRRPPVG